MEYTGSWGVSCDGNTSGCPTWHVKQYGLLGNNIVRIMTLYELRSCTGYEVVQVTRACATKCYETERVSVFNNSSC